jgi:hypothetical protein
MSDNIMYKDAVKNGELLYEFETGDYSWDAIAIYKVGDEYAYFTDGGCSCNGAFEDESERCELYSKAQMRRIVEGWSDKPDEYQADTMAKAAYGKEWNL